MVLSDSMMTVADFGQNSVTSPSCSPELFLPFNPYFKEYKMGARF